MTTTPTPVSAPVAAPQQPAPAPPPAQAPTAPVEPTTPPATPPPDPQWTSKFAAVTRKEQAAVKALADAKAEKAAADKARADAKAIEDKWNGFKGNPAKAMEALKELGYTYEQITQLYLNNGQVTPEMQTKQLQDRIDGLEAQRLKDLEDARNSEVTAAKAAEQRAVETFQTQIVEHAADKTKYPLINHFNVVAQVWGLIEGHYNNTCERDADGAVTKPGQILAIPEAAKQVEDYLRDQVTKSQALLNPPPATPAPSTPAAPPPKQSPFKPVSKPSTLTPSMTPVTTPKTTRVESDQERMARIVAKYSKKPA